MRTTPLANLRDIEKVGNRADCRPVDTQSDQAGRTFPISALPSDGETAPRRTLPLSFVSVDFMGASIAAGSRRGIVLPLGQSCKLAWH
jgi:hypothetical protein